MLITTGIKREKLQDIDQLFFEESVRGELKVVRAVLYFEPKNKYL